MNGNFIIQYAAWLNTGVKPGWSGQFLKGREYLVKDKKIKLKYFINQHQGSIPGYKVYVEDQHRRVFLLEHDSFKEFLLEYVCQQRFKKHMSSLLETQNKENKMTRLSWSVDETTGNVYNNKVVLNGVVFTTTILPNFSYTVINDSGTTLVNGQSKSLASAKKNVKKELMTLGVVFGSEVRVKTNTQAAA